MCVEHQLGCRGVPHGSRCGAIKDRAEPAARAAKVVCSAAPFLKDDSSLSMACVLLSTAWAKTAIRATSDQIVATLNPFEEAGNTHTHRAKNTTHLTLAVLPLRDCAPHPLCGRISLFHFIFPNLLPVPMAGPAAAVAMECSLWATTTHRSSNLFRTNHLLGTAS